MLDVGERDEALGTKLRGDSEAPVGRKRDVEDPAALCSRARSTTIWRAVSMMVISDSGGVRKSPGSG